jgi:RAC serine/threonine-protein kinase
MADKAGWLTKEGGSIKTVKKRWFILKNGILSYYKNQGDSEPKGTIEIAIASTIRVSTDKKKKPNCFEVVTPTRIYAIFAENETDRSQWIEALNVAKQKENAKSSPEQKLTVEDFSLLNVIGKGSFGKVMQVKKKDNGKIYAMKVLDKKHILEHNEVEHTLAERNILRKLHHPFLVNLNFSFQTEDKLYFILDYVNGGELFFHLQREKRFSEERVRFYCSEIVLALEHLHINGIIYRDLKPENILLTNEGHICLTDFGLSKEGIEKEDDRTGTFCGTPEYLAPEVLKGKGYGKAVDWWSFGSLMYEMLTGLPPFYSQDVQEMYRKIMTDKLKFPPTMSEGARILIEGLLQRDPAERLRDPSKIKEHAFFNNLDWNALYNKKIKPPFVPNVKGETDVSNVDNMFLSESNT